MSESFPEEVRALAIALFYAFGAVLMIAAALVTLWLGFAAERKPLEEVARPFSWLGREEG